MKKLLVAVLLSTLPAVAFAFEPDSGLQINISGGYTPSILEINSGTSYGGYVGYKFNPYLSVEGGYTSLLKQSQSGVTTAASIYGPEIAGYLTVRINDLVSPFVRASFSKFAMTQSTGGIVNSIQTIYGPSYGVGFQFYEADFFSLRVGYNTYYLQTSNDYYVQAGIPITTSNTYVALLMQFGDN